MEHLASLRQHHQLSDAEFEAIAKFMLEALVKQQTPDQVGKWLALVEHLREDREYLLHLAGYETEMWDLEEDCTTDLNPVSEETALAVVQQAASAARHLPDNLVQKLFFWPRGAAEPGLLSKYRRLAYCFNMVSRLSQHNAETLLSDLSSLSDCQAPQCAEIRSRVTLAIGLAW